MWKGLEGEESSRRRDERESNWYGEGPKVGIDGLGACEEWGSCRGRVKKIDGGVGEHGKPVGANNLPVISSICTFGIHFMTIPTIVQSDPS